MDRLIARLQPGPTIVGTAITVAVPSEDNSILHHALSLIRPGDILIVDRLGDTNVACYGGTINHAAKLRGAAAVIIDGPCTDVREIRKVGSRSGVAVARAEPLVRVGLQVGLTCQSPSAEPW